MQLISSTRPLWFTLVLSLCGAAMLACAPEEPGDKVARIYTEQCATCHGVNRYGGYAPPLIPQSLSRKTDEVLVQTLLEGRPNTQMLPFQNLLSEAEAQIMVARLREPVEEIAWGMEEIAQSRVEPPREGEERTIPAEIKRENIILVVARGTGEISVLNGDTFMELDRFPVGRIHGGPKFDRDYTRVFAITRDGTLVSYDLEQGYLRSMVKVGVNSRNVAISPDGAFVAVTDLLPAQLVILTGELEVLTTIPLGGQPSGVYQIPGEPRFVLTLRDSPKLLTVSYPDLEMTEVDLPEPFEDFMFIPGRTEVLASSRGGQQILLYDLAEQEVRASLATEALPHLFSACFFLHDGKQFAALNHIGAPKLSIIDLERFELVKEIPLAGSGFFARTHAGTPYIWVDTNTEQIQLVDKASLTLREEPLIPDPGKKAMHVEFNTDGSRAMVSVWDKDGWVVVYDSNTLEEQFRLPYNMPIGKYNAYNKTRFLY